MVLSISFLTLLAISGISYSRMLRLVKYSQDANIHLGITAAEQSKSALLAQAERHLQKIAEEQANDVNTNFVRVHANVLKMQQFVEALYAAPGAFTGKRVPRPEETRMDVLSAKYTLAPDTVWNAAAAEELRRVSSAEYMFSAVLSTNSTVFNAYLGTERGITYRYSSSNRVSPGYDPRTRNWYMKAMETPGKVIWTGTYLDSYGAICNTCAVSYRDERGRNAGVVATDIRMTTMIQQILDLQLGEEGFAFLLGDNGEYIAHPRYGEPDFNTRPLEEATGEWRELLISLLLEGRHGAHTVEINGQEYKVFSVLISETGWTLCVCMSVAEIIAPANATKAEIDLFTDNALATIRHGLARVVMQFIIIFAVSAILVAGFSFALSQTITRPIQALAKKVNLIGSGRLDARIEVHGKDEVAELGNAFNKMADDIWSYIENLKAVTAEKERLNGELMTAAKIQSDLLPHIFPKFANRRELTLFAKMKPAKHVGGDFYDFFYLDDAQTKIAFIIADVSGTGVPAALFMVIAKTLLKTQMQQTHDPAVVLATVNNLLCQDNTQNMFVTVFLCAVDLDTLQMTYANAGHNPPLARFGGPHGDPDAPYKFLKLGKGIPLGLQENNRYLLSKTQLYPGDRLYLYTDGVNEAMNKDGQLFGNAAFLAAANDSRGMGPAEFDGAIRARIAAFADGTEQSDDITTVAIAFL